MEKEMDVVEGKVDWKGRAGLRHKHGGYKTSLFILATLGLENMAVLALAVNLVTYFHGVMHFNIADAANELTNFMGISYILSIVTAVIADTYLGRVKTAIISAFIEFIALLLLTVQAHYPKLRPPYCNLYDPTSHCEKVHGGSAALLYIPLYTLAAGIAGIKATLPSHGADQFNEKDPKEAKQMSSFFNLLLLVACVGGAVSLTLVVWIQDEKGWDWGLAVSSLAMLLSLLVFIAGLPLYRLNVMQGTSPILEIIQVYVAAIRNRNLDLPQDATNLYEIDMNTEAVVGAEFLPHSDDFRFLDKAAIQPTQVEQFGHNTWRLCRITQVENAKIILSMLPIFLCTIIMTLCLAQLQTFSIQQGLTMDTKLTKSFNIPPASLPLLPTLFIIIIVPFYDFLFVPFARKLTGIPTGITQLQRIGVGLVLSCISMAIAALIEAKRKDVIRAHHMYNAVPIREPLPISTFWLSFQFFIFGIADLFTYIGLLEFFYSEAPKGLKSISTCFLWCSMAMGYFLSTILVKIVNRATKASTRSGGWLAGNNINVGHLNLFYWLLCVISFFNFCVYLFVANKYKYRPKNLVVSHESNKA